MTKHKCSFIKIIFFILFFSYSYASNKIILIKDDEIESLIKELLKPILKISGQEYQDINIKIYDHNDPNAFVMFGQNIFISTGLINFSDNPDMLIGVLAHEIGHIQGGHLVKQTQELKRLETKVLLGLLAGTLIGVASKSTEAAAGTVMGVQNMNEKNYFLFSRAQENAADSLSIKVMNNLGISSDGLLEFLKSLKTIEKTFYSDISEYERTHPLSKDRIEYIRANSLNKSTDQIVTKDIRERFKRVHAKVYAFSSSSSSTFNHFKGINSFSSQYAKAIAYFKEQNPSQSICIIDELIKVAPEDPYLYELKGQILYESGEIKASVEFYRKAHRLKPSSDIITMEYANSLISTSNDISTVISMLKRIVSKNRDEDYAWWLLSKSYKIMKDENNMHIAIAYNSYLNNDISNSRKHINAVSKNRLNKEERNKVIDLQHLINQKDLEEG